MRRARIKGLPGTAGPSRSARHQPQVTWCRQFTCTLPDQLWVTDITECPTREGKVYCAVVLDAWSRRVEGWSIDSTQTGL